VIYTQTLVLIAVIISVVSAAFALQHLFSLIQIGSHIVTPTLAEPRVATPSPFAPEPVERAIFVTLAALSPICLVAAAKLMKARAPTNFARWPISIALCILLTAPFVSSEFTSVLFFPVSLAHESRPVMLSAAALLTAMVLAENKFRSSQAKPGGAAFLILSCLLAFFLQIAPYRVASENTVTTAAQWSVSYDAAIFALTQVIAGKTLLSDLPSQYGLFPELIAPIFKTIGSSIFTINTFFATLQMLGLYCIASILNRFIRNTALKTMTFLCVIISTGLFLYLNEVKEELYMQYYPIRFICPAVALLAFSAYCINPSRKLIVALGIISGISIFWNFDSGIPVLIAICATLFVRPAFRDSPSIRDWFPALSVFAIAAVVFLALMTNLRIKSGAPLQIGEAISYQKLFYGSGFMMLPMPTNFNPWQVVILGFAAGGVASLTGWRRRSKNPVYDFLFCVSLMGLGLFTYYPGRSHIFCLMMVLWPVLIVAGILTDLVLRSLQKGRTHSSSLLLALPFISFASLGATTLAFSSDELITTGLTNLQRINQPKDKLVTDELNFLRATDKGRNCLILSQRQAIYHAELNTSSPVSGPGMIETLLQKDLDEMQNNAMKSNINCIYLGIGEYSRTLAKLNDSRLIAEYPIIAKNDLGTILLLEPKQTTINPAK